MKLKASALMGVSWLALAGTASAQAEQGPASHSAQAPDPRAAQVQALEQRLAEIETQLEDLKASTAAETSDIRRIQSDAPQTSFANGRLRWASADGQFSVQLRGVAQYDLAHHEQDTPSGVDNRRSDSSNPGDLNSGGNFRRARFGLEGTAYRNWNYALIYELGGTGTESAQMSQAYIEYAGWRPLETAAPVRFRVGAWATPTGLEDATSNPEHVFLEWAAPADLARGLAGGDGRTGAGVFWNGDRWYASAVWTGALMANSGEFDEQSGYLARVAFLPWRGENHGIHTGVNVAGVIDPADANPGTADTLQLRLRGRPELRVDGARFVDTGNVAADGAVAYGFELGGFYKNFYLTGEAHHFELSRTDGFADPHFNGWYVQAAWTLTGERRRWNPSSGGFSGVRPVNAFDPASGDLGAWEIAVRYSELDLNYNEGAPDSSPATDAIRGGVQNVTTLALSWTPNAVIRFVLQAQNIEIDRLDPENGSIVTPVGGVGAQIGQDFQTIALRSQVAF